MKRLIFSSGYGKTSATPWRSFFVAFIAVFLAFSPLANVALADEADKKDDLPTFPSSFCYIDLVSDTTNKIDNGEFAVQAYSAHPYWTATMEGTPAMWIWRTYFVEHPDQEETVTFTKTFEVNQEVEFATLTLAADNSYEVYLNGTKVAENTGEFNYRVENKATINLHPFVVQGHNELSFKVKNWAQATSTPETNPAGLLYAAKITMKGECGANPPPPPPPPPTPPAPTVEISANPSAVFTGATSTLSWTSTNAKSCSASWTTATSTSGSQTVSPSSTSDYSVTCTGDGGTTIASTKITVNPIVIEGCANGVELTFAEFKAAVSKQKIDYSLDVSSDGKQSTFTLNNRTGCSVPISLSAYKMFDTTLSHQKIFDGTGLVSATSTTVLSVILPPCMAQIDAWYGLYPQTLENSNPYGFPNVPGVITYKKTNLPFCTVSSSNTPPTITLLGDNPLNFIIGGTFTDPGATATDTEDGNLTSHIISTSTVSTTTAGTYQIKYSVTDSGGLSASTTRTVVVSQPSGCTSNCGGGGGGGTPSIPLDRACTIVSDTNTFANDKASVLAYDQNPLWTVSIPRASWIWSTFKVVNPEATTTVTFEKHFFATSTSASAILDIAADDTYRVKLNGVQVAVGGSHEVSKEHNISSALVAGTNVMTIEVSNLPIIGSTPESNPAGLIYKLNLSGNGCGTPTNTPPTITLLGDNPLNFIIGGTFTDPGATATDTEDGNLTSHIISTSTVSTTTAGTYQIKYSVTDSGGLSASTTRTVVVSQPSGCTSNCGGGGSNSPSVSISAIPSSINLGATSTLSWTSTNTSFCSADWTSATSTSGSQEVSPSSTSQYSISCGGSFGTSTATTTVTVNQPENNGGGGGGGGSSSGGGGGGGIGGHRHDITGILGSQGEILGATSCTYLRDYLKIGWNNDPIEVLKLKSFLNVFENEKLSLTTVFDQPTYDAVSRFQNKYFDDILAPWGHKAPTGFVYILTKKKVNEIYCNTVLSLTQDQKDEISSFKALLDSYNVLSEADTISGRGVGYSPSRTGNAAIQAALSGAVSGIDLNSPFVVELKDNSTTTKDLDNKSIVRNVAISLFGLPQKIFNDSKNAIFFLIILILVVTIISLFMADTKKVDDPLTAEVKESIEKEKESPVIILPGTINKFDKNKVEDVLPDEEIIIDNDEENL